MNHKAAPDTPTPSPGGSPPPQRGDWHCPFNPHGVEHGWVVEYPC